MLTARPYSPTDDEPLITDWWRANTGEDLAGATLPPLGVIVEDDSRPVAAAWAFLGVGVPSAFLDAPLTRPGLSEDERQRALTYAIAAIEDECRTRNCGVLVSYARPDAAPDLERQGFHRLSERIAMVKLLRAD